MIGVKDTLFSIARIYFILKPNLIKILEAQLTSKMLQFQILLK